MATPYILIDTPERGMPYYAEARQANRQLVEGKTVYLVKDVLETDRLRISLVCRHRPQ